MIDFTKRKFLKLSLQQQHKACASCVRTLYVSCLQGQIDTEVLTCYKQMTSWMEEPAHRLEPLEELSNLYHYHRLLANQNQLEHNFLPHVRTQDHVSNTPFLPIHIYLDHLRSAHNVGSIIRTVEAFRLGTLYFSPSTPFIDHPQVQATSMGADAFVTCYRNLHFQELPRPLIALETCENAEPLYNFIFPSSFSLAVGNEEYGCSNEVLTKADIILEIPLRGSKNSLNVANAFAIVAAAIARQHYLQN